MIELDHVIVGNSIGDLDASGKLDSIGSSGFYNPGKFLEVCEKF